MKVTSYSPLSERILVAELRPRLLHMHAKMRSRGMLYMEAVHAAEIGLRISGRVTEDHVRHIETAKYLMDRARADFFFAAAFEYDLWGEEVMVRSDEGKLVLVGPRNHSSITASIIGTRA